MKDTNPVSNTTDRTKPLRDMLDSLYRRRLALVEETDSLEERISHLEGTLLKLEGQADVG